jgi:hypothetical protein
LVTRCLGLVAKVLFTNAAQGELAPVEAGGSPARGGGKAVTARSCEGVVPFAESDDESANRQFIRFQSTCWHRTRCQVREDTYAVTGGCFGRSGGRWRRIGDAHRGVKTHPG